MISKALDYAMRSMVYMTAQGDNTYFGVKELAEKIQVSSTYLGKVLQSLVKSGYLKSTTGPGGGFALARDPETIKLIELIECVDGSRLREKCILGLTECSEANPCPIHETWKSCRSQLTDDLSETSLAQVIGKSWPQYR
ncbi:MAG: Rrf2 family transcriptional regulator [Leptospiraceae bacterium]|nr:Rrf2 family transcriptional regulator [Leptospiraceae bacterium]MCB1316463.1 Rrf2 family transcriptional regulator [Leptospiraceae bacterium]